VNFVSEIHGKHRENITHPENPSIFESTTSSKKNNPFVLLGLKKALNPTPFPIKQGMHQFKQAYLPNFEAKVAKVN